MKVMHVKDDTSELSNDIVVDYATIVVPSQAMYEEILEQFSENDEETRVNASITFNSKEQSI